jgi:hypothetical protein
MHELFDGGGVGRALRFVERGATARRVKRRDWQPSAPRLRRAER